MPAGEAALQVAELDPRDRAILHGLAIDVGGRVIFVQGLLGRAARERRFALCRAYFEAEAPAEAPRPSAVSIAPARGVSERAYAALGFPVFGDRAVRADIAERVHRALTAGGEPPAPGLLAGWMGCGARDAARVADAIGRG